MPSRITPKEPYLRDRDPLLIPQPVAAASVPWYRRCATIVYAIVALLGAALLAYLVHRFGWHGTLERAARAGAAFMTSFTRLVSR